MDKEDLGFLSFSLKRFEVKSTAFPIHGIVPVLSARYSATFC